MNSGSSPRNRVARSPSASDSEHPPVFGASDPLWDQLHAVRRRLWIISATLETLPAKIEAALRKSGDLADGLELDHPRHSTIAPQSQRLARLPEKFIAAWWARRKVARLISRADRAERKAAAAIQHVSTSFAAALEAFLQAAVDRVNAQEARLNTLDSPDSRAHD
jgi:hypothetical protein